MADKTVENDSDIREIISDTTNYNKTVFDEYGKFIKYYEYGIQQAQQQTNEPNSGDAEDKPSSNQVYKYVSKVLPLLYHQDPSISVIPNLGASSRTLALLEGKGLVGEGAKFATFYDAKLRFAEILSFMLKYSYRETLSVEYNKACVFESLLKGQSASKVCIDVNRGIDTIDCVRREELYIDPTARIDITQAEYANQIICNPLAKSRAFFKKIGYTGQIEANTSMSEQNTNEKDYFGAANRKKAAFKFVEMWLKDFENGNHKILYYDAITCNKIYERAWPFELDTDDFPFEVLAYNKKYTCIRDAFTEIKVVEGLWKFYEYLIWYFYDDTMRSLAQPIFYDPAVVSPEKLKEAVEGKNRIFIPIENFEKAKLGDFFYLPDLGKGSDNPTKYIELINSLAESVLGVEIINFASTQKLKDVREAPMEFMHDDYMTKLEDKQSSTDRWLTRQIRHRAQVARQTIKGSKVQELLGSDAAALWDILAYDKNDLKNEYSIDIVAGSSGERAKREAFDRLSKVTNMLRDINKDAGMPLYNVMAPMRELIRLVGDEYVDRFENKMVTEAVNNQTRMPVYPNKQNIEGLIEGVQANLFNKNEARAQIGLNPVEDQSLDFSVLNSPDKVQTNVEVPAVTTTIDESAKAVSEVATAKQAEQELNNGVAN